MAAIQSPFSVKDLTANSHTNTSPLPAVADLFPITSKHLTHPETPRGGPTLSQNTNPKPDKTHRAPVHSLPTALPSEFLVDFHTLTFLPECPPAGQLANLVIFHIKPVGPAPWPGFRALLPHKCSLNKHKPSPKRPRAIFTVVVCADSAKKHTNKKGMNLPEDKTHETHHPWKHTTEMPFSSYYWDKWKINSIPLSASDPRQQAIARTTPP